MKSSPKSLPSTSPAVAVVAVDSRRDLQMRIGVIVAGFCTFLPIYATQPLLPEFRRIFSASALAVSLTVSAVTLAIAISSPWIGSLADAVGRKRVIVAAILGLSVPTCLAATSSNLSQLIAWRFTQGLFVPGIIAVTLAYIAEEALAGTAASVTAAYITGTIMGGMSGRFIAAMIAEHSGWRQAFVSLGLTSLLCGLLAWVLLPRSRRFVRQRNLLAPLRSMVAHLGNRRLLATYFVGFNALFTLVGVFTYANFYLAGKPFGLGLVALGSVFLVYGLGVVVTPAAGRVIDRYGYRSGMVMALTIALAGLLLTLIPVTWSVVLGLALLSTGIFIAQSGASSHVGVVAKTARSSAAGLYVCFYYLGGSLGATLLGWLWRTHGWTGCVACVAMLQVFSAAIALRWFAPASSEKVAAPTGPDACPPG
ncbi:MAG: MFS transporter [Planctomycetaceae bacterium]|nr:MFS transporter [Planctomycetaceae bacterium]